MVDYLEVYGIKVGLYILGVNGKLPHLKFRYTEN